MLVQVGNTTLLSTVVTTKPREGIDFFPLTVDVEERMYAAGKIPGAVFRREGRPSEPAVLTCRLTDRPLRPSFPEGFRNEVQVIATIIGADLENPHDIASINGASAALMVSGIPFDGPIGAVRLSRHGSEWITHPTFEESTESTFELVVAGRRVESGDIAIMMVEAGGTEATWRLYEEGAPKVTEEVIAEGIEEAKVGIGLAIDLQKELVAAVVREHGPIEPIPYEVHTDYDDDVFEAVAGEATAEHRRGDGDRRQDRAQRTASTRSRKGCCSRCAARQELPGPFLHERGQVQARVPCAAEEGRAQPHRQRGPAHRRPRHHRPPAAFGRRRAHPHLARLGPVPAGRDPGAQRPHARHAPHGAVDRPRRVPRHDQALHPPLQLPAVLHG